MIAYLEKYNTTVDIPDTASDKDVQDINDNFHHYVDPNPPQSQPAQPATAEPAAATTPATQPQWQPNFYQASLAQVVAPLKALGQATESPQAQAFAGKTLEEGSFGLAKPLTEVPELQQAYKDHPAFADAGAVTGGIGSLMAAGGALRIAGLAEGAAAAGKTAVEAGFSAGERFIPRAIMTGATFGTQSFIRQTVKAFQDGGVNLEQFGKDVLKDTAFGSIFGSIGGLDAPVASVSSAGGLGFLSAKMSGADNREASLHAAVWAAFETVGQVGKSEALRMEALGNLKDSISEYARARNPDLTEEMADKASGAFLDHAITKAGYPDAESIAKSGPENLLEGIERVNHMVRTAQIPAAEEGAPALPKLPAPAEPESPNVSQGTPPEAPQAPQTPLQKALDYVKTLMGIKGPEADTQAQEGNLTHEQAMENLKAQGHDISKIPESEFPADLKDVYHYEQARGLKEGLTKAITDISGRLSANGLSDDEQNAIFGSYDLDKVGMLGQSLIDTDLFRMPIDDQYKKVYSILAAERGIPNGEGLPQGRFDEWKEILKSGIQPPPGDVADEYSHIPLWMKNKAGRGYDEVAQEAREKGLLGENEDLWEKLRNVKREAKSEKYDARTMDDAEKAVDLMNGYFNPQSQDVAAFVAQHQNLSQHDIAQMAYHRGLIDEPNPDLLKAEVDKSKQENIVGVPKENVSDRYERLVKQAMDQGLSRPQATQWAKQQMQKALAKPEGDKPEQTELGTEGGVQSFGRGKKGAQELSFSKVSAMKNDAVTSSFEFKKWFGKSKVVDDKGKPLIVYHGTGNAENIANKGFSYEFVDKGNDQFGSGFYFTNKPETASGDTQNRLNPETEKLGGETSPGVFPVYVSIKKPIEIDSQGGIKDAQIKMTATQLKKLIMSAPDIKNPDGPLANWGDVRHEGFQKVLSTAIDAYREGVLNPIANDFFPGEAPTFLKAIRDITSYDGVVTSFPNGEKHFVAWFPEQIKSAFSQSFNPNSAKISAQIAPGSSLPRMNTPITAEAVASSMKASANEITNIVNPTKAAPLAAAITREQLGIVARSYDMAEASLEDAHDLFEKQGKDANLKFIDNMERGLAQDDPKQDEIAKTLRKLFDDKRQEIQDLGTGKLKHFIENYFPHIWDQGEKEVGDAVRKAAKRPLEGSKGFMKERSIEFTSDGIAAGLTPVSFNPVDLTLLKLREMDKYLMAHRTIQEYKANGLAKYVKIGDEMPEGWTKIDDRISTVFKSPMVAVKEAYDAKMMDDLSAVGKSLGIDLERGARMKGEGKKFGDVWGLSMSNAQAPGQPGKIFTRFAGPESALAHELGHQIDHIYSLQAKFMADPAIRKELTDLANERATEDASDKFKDYIQQPDEKMAVMFEAYIHSPNLFKETAPKAYKMLEAFLKSDPKLKPITDIEPSLQMAVNKSEVYAGGAVIAGHIYAQPDAARIINNYLSPGLQKSEVYQAYRYVGNTINQFQLGFSAFHLGFTSLDTSISKLALALGQLEQGHPMKAIRDAAHVPFAPIENFIRGDQLLKAWRGQGQNGIDNILAQAMASGGGRARMDQFYATRAYDQMKHYFQAGNVLRGVLHIPMSIMEISSKPILEYIVPRQKLGVFADMMKMEMENNPDMTHDQMRAIAQRAWDSVDNRMGQMVYDNLFWNRTFKDLLMGTLRSTGWNVGTAREILGGVAEAGTIPKMASGEKFDTPHKLNYDIAMPLLVGLLGAMAQYLMTGKGPQELKDYYFPKTGGIDKNGDPHRITFPSYMKDLYHWKENPGKTAIDKLHPIFSMVGDMLQNKDYFGTKIRNEDDPIVKQVASEIGFILKQIQPFSIRNMQKNLETQNKSLFDTVGPWVGITPAPYDIDQTKAEKLAHEIAASHQEIGGRTQEQMERSKLISDLTRQYRQGDPKAMTNIFTAYQQGAISHTQMREVIANAHLTPLQKMVKRMTVDEAERVYAKANDEEKGQLDTMIEQKKLRHERQYVVQ